MLKTDSVEITWLGHASFKITCGSDVIYIDPWKLASAEKATLVLVTHDHFDHCSPADVERVSDDKTVIIATPDCAPKFKGQVKAMQPGESAQVKKIIIETVPAYNTDKNFHPKVKNWVGYIITIGGKRIYHAGDTDQIPEMANLTNIDIALLPVSGIYVMTAEQAAEAAKRIKAKITIPMHYGDIAGSQQDAQRFKALSEGLRVEILEKGQ